MSVIILLPFVFQNIYICPPVIFVYTLIPIPQLLIILSFPNYNLNDNELKYVLIIDIIRVDYNCDLKFKI